MLDTQFPFLAIDYGSKLAGTTVVCFAENNVLQFIQSERKQDADAFLVKAIKELAPAKVYMDAPSSLPEVYRGKGDDYFYRRCDREVRAMSPMFLGGLTARAMQLDAKFPDVPFYEIYPAEAVRSLLKKEESYKKDLSAFVEKLKPCLPVGLSQEPLNWHQVDAALAWWSGWRQAQGKARAIGDPEEGLIYV